MSEHTCNEKNMSISTSSNTSDVEPRAQINAGDRVYIPAGGLQLWINEDGNMDFGATLAVDPWLPDLVEDPAVSLGVIESILQRGFRVGDICNRDTIYGCQISQDVQDLMTNSEIRRLSHLVVVEGGRAIGILDLNLLRSKYDHSEAKSSLLIESLYEPVNSSNSMRGDAPLMDYLLTADAQPFRLIQLDGERLGVVDVEDLQKPPVRVVLLIWFSYLELLLTRILCQEKPDFKEIVSTRPAVEAANLGSTGPGPERRIERSKFSQLLREVRETNSLPLLDDEIMFLNEYRNRIFHGPRWYITRRHEVLAFVNCLKKLVSLVSDLGSE